jgi:uncharacterized protein
MDKNNLSKKVGLLLAGCFITFNALGQTTIKGQVVDATGEPVIGASILVKDTKNGAVSDLDGNYKLDNVKDGSVLVFSYLGYRTQEIPVKGNHVINVSLKENDEVLDEYREYPLSFEEYLSFKGVEADKYSEEGKAMMASAFRDYCEEGGFPEVVRAKSRSEKVKILQSYFSTMLFRDMMEHYHIGASSTVVRYFLKRVMNNLTKPTSVNNIYNDLKSQGLKVSKDSLYLWLDYACNIFLFRKVQKYTKSLVKQSSAPSKYYMADIAMRNAVLLPESEDAGKALENIVYLNLERSLGEEDRITYFCDQKECDFVVQRGERVSELIQVCWALNEENLEREVGGLLAASVFTGCRQCRILTFNQQQTIERDGIRIEVLPVWV